MSMHRPADKRVERLDWRSGPAVTAASSGIDWPHWLRGIERKRRLLINGSTNSPRNIPRSYFAEATYSSFRLEGIDTSRREVEEALGMGSRRQTLRSRSAQRIRNHVCILRHMEASSRMGESLKPWAVMRWYTSVGCGLINAGLSDVTLDRLSQVVRQLNSPQLRLQPAMIDIAKLHSQLLSDPLVPSFNGIIARLLLQSHLGRSGLPPIVFDPETDAPRLLDPNMLLTRLLELVEQSYDLLLRSAP